MLLQDLDLGDDMEVEESENRIFLKWRKYLIEPSNSKLKKFHLLASISLFIDFFLTCFILGNYKFQIGEDDPNFMNHEAMYWYLNIILGLDIFLTFFKQLKIDVIIIDDPKEIAWSYISG